MCVCMCVYACVCACVYAPFAFRTYLVRKQRVKGRACVREEGEEPLGEQGDVGEGVPVFGVCVSVSMCV